MHSWSGRPRLVRNSPAWSQEAPGARRAGIRRGVVTLSQRPADGRDERFPRRVGTRSRPTDAAEACVASHRCRGDRRGLWRLRARGARKALEAHVPQAGGRARWKFCTEETKYCFPTCCPPERRCKVGPRDPKNGCPEYTTCPCKDPCGPGLRQCCGTDEHCSWPGKDEGFPQNGLCCPKGQLGCGVDGPRSGANWTFCCPKKCCGRRGKGHCCPEDEGRV